MYRDLDPKIREEFERKGVKHIRNYASPDEKGTKGFQLKPFQEYVSRHSVSSYTKPFLSCFFIFTRKFQSEMSE